MNRALYFASGVLAAAAVFGLGIAFRGSAGQRVVTRAGETVDADTGWKVSVDANSGRHSVTREGFSMSPAWPMKPGWFVFLESHDRAWSYNGEDQLVVFVASDTKGKTAGAFSPDNSPFPVPDAVVRRIGEQRVRAIALAAREARERLGLSPAR